MIKLIIALSLFICFLLILCYCLMVTAHEADEKAERMYKEWKEKDND